MEGTHLMGTVRTTSLLCTLVTAFLLAPFVEAQKKKKLPRWKIDPYTKNDPAAMKKAGYVSFGPFPFGELGTKLISSKHIDDHLNYDKIRWVETAHFRIGCSLRAWAIPTELEVKRKLRKELEQLKKKLGRRVNPKTRVLDEWLRLHLIAQRMEDLYAEIQDWLGVKDSQFPKDSKSKVYGATYMGEGKYMGMNEKFMILVTNKGNTYFDYLKNFTGRQSKFGQRWHYMKQGALFYGIGSDMNKGALRHDTALHCDLVFNATINIIDGFRHYSYDLPVWIREGLGHFFQRRVNPKWNSFDQDEASPFDPPSKWNWPPYVRQLLPGKKWSHFAKVIQWRHYGDINFVDHVVLWARIDFLMSFGKEKFRAFMFEIKGRYDHKTGLPLNQDLVGVTRDALKKAYGLSPLNFDAKFKEWAVATYPLR
jgi:hypothetical protein